MTVYLFHPDIALIESIGEVYASVLSGDWAIAARLCGSEIGGRKMADQAGAERALSEAAEAAGITFPDRAQVTFPTHLASGRGDTSTGPGGAVLRVDTSPRFAIGALDLFSRLLCGQWDHLYWAVASRSEGRDLMWDPFSLNMIRCSFSHLALPTASGVQAPPMADHQFPRHPGASISIASSVPAAKVAYHAFRHLGGGPSQAEGDRGPTFALPGGHMRVEIDEIDPSAFGNPGYRPRHRDDSATEEAVAGAAEDQAQQAQAETEVRS